jgi:uncharacterized protein
MDQPFTLKHFEPADYPHWQALAEGRLLIQRCKTCGRYFFPAAQCSCSAESEMEWIESSRRGTLHATGTWHQAYAAHLKEQIPYTVCVVKLEEGPVLLSRLDERVQDRPAVGDPVLIEVGTKEGELTTHRVLPLERGAH